MPRAEFAEISQTRPSPSFLSVMVRSGCGTKGSALDVHSDATTTGTIVLAESGFLKLNGVFKTIEVKMIDRKAVDLVGLQQREGRAFYTAFKSEGAQSGSHQVGFTGA